MAEQQHSQLPTQASVPTLPQVTTTTETIEITTVGNDVHNSAESKALAEIAERVKERAFAIQSQASELQELEVRLQAAERKKQELEAKGLHV